MGFGHILSPDGLINTLLSQGCVLVPPWEPWVEHTFKGWDGEGATCCWGPARRSTCICILPMNFSNSVYLPSLALV